MKLKFSENATKFFDEIFVLTYYLSKKAFFNYIDKRNWAVNPKMSTFNQLS